jgi:hypothetical protein
MNQVTVRIYTELDCDPNEGEYSLMLADSSVELDLNGPGGKDDISLIKEAIYEFDFDELPEEGVTEIKLVEHLEVYDVYVNKYYIIENWEIVDE